MSLAVLPTLHNLKVAMNLATTERKGFLILSWCLLRRLPAACSAYYNMNKHGLLKYPTALSMIFTFPFCRYIKGPCITLTRNHRMASL
uniref:Putative secreted protein ovary overexpressed n=1 Tax=Rhipicephalus microplus TaxID=6941 RepID=A0A6M2DAG0_RHIMP